MIRGDRVIMRGLRSGWGQGNGAVGPSYNGINCSQHVPCTALCLTLRTIDDGPLTPRDRPSPIFRCFHSSDLDPQSIGSPTLSLILICNISIIYFFYPS